jgi:hypothetical protein
MKAEVEAKRRLDRRDGTGEILSRLVRFQDGGIRGKKSEHASGHQGLS